MRPEMSSLTRRLVPVLAPLGKKEERRAIKAALDWMAVDLSGLKETRFRLLGAELRIDKPPTPRGVPRRLVRVLIADYTNRRNVDVTVDAEGRVLNGSTLHRFQPAFHAEEIGEARDIAEHDSRVASVVRRRGAFPVPFAPGHGTEPGPRAVGLHYLVATRGGGAAPLATVVVDLYEQSVSSFEDERLGQRTPRRSGQQQGGSRGRLR